MRGQAPGGPIHVLLTDEGAEPIYGCNMAFYEDALEEVGAFDPQFRIAGDDVNVCWKLQQRGWTLGFNPAAWSGIIPEAHCADTGGSSSITVEPKRYGSVSGRINTISTVT